MKFLCLLYFVFCRLHFLNGSIAPDDVRSDFTNETYNDVLLNPLFQQLEDYVAGIRDKSYNYVPDDVALVNSILSIEEAIFKLAHFYGMHKEATSISRFSGGLAIQFESHRCDQVYSSKFPRERPTVEPWKFYRDTVFFNVNCEMPKAKRKRREISTLRNHTIHRGKRNVPRMVKNPPICGDEFHIISSIGELSFPSNRSLNYTTNTLCEWLIQVPPNFMIDLSIRYLDLEEDKQCEYDSISFYDGPDTNSRQIAKTCGERLLTGVLSTGYFMTILLISDKTIVGSGFELSWTIGLAAKPQTIDYPELDNIGHSDNSNNTDPGFIMTSNIVIDQVGDLNIDTFDTSTLKNGDLLQFYFNDDFKLQIPDASTCPLHSNDPSCYFETQPSIISKFVATAVSPNVKLPDGAIEIVFDHVIQTDMYPSLYEAPKYCITWDSTVENSDYGSWSKKGKIYKTDTDRTTCRFSEPGIHAVAAAVPLPVVPSSFSFSISWYCGLVFTIIWIIYTLFRLSTSKMNIPDWLNMNQMIALLIFAGVVLSGMHLELDQGKTCNYLSFLLYYAGLAIFVWHFLKAAQFTGTFDKFFRAERNLFAFYFLLGWFIPFFIAGIAGSASLHLKKERQSCWMAMKGGEIWSKLTPTYFLVAANFYLYYKGLKRAKLQDDFYNYPKMRMRAVVDCLVLTLFLLSWLFGLLCILKEEAFAPQFFFCMTLSSTTIILCLTAKQKRRSFEKAYDHEDHDSGEEKYKEHQKFIEGQDGLESELEYERKLMKVFFDKWNDRPEPLPLELGLKFAPLEGAVIVKRFSRYEIQEYKLETGWNDKYTNENKETSMFYDEDIDEQIQYSEPEDNESEEEDVESDKDEEFTESEDENDDDASDEEEENK